MGQTPVERVQERQGEILRRWGPVELDPVTIARFDEAEGWTGPGGSVSPAILLQLGNERVDVHHDRRPHETIDPGLRNPVNGGTAIWWTRPVAAGDVVSGEVSLKSASTRPGRSGPLALVVIETRITDASGALLARTEKTVIFREGG